MTNRIKVLIGNDAADCGMAWAGALKGAGMYAITRHCDGNAVLSSIKSEAPDVAVLEAKMPYCDAVEVIRRLKNTAPTYLSFPGLTIPGWSATRSTPEPQG